MVQDILSDMSSDEVNSIDDTTEALQVAQIIKSCYFEMIGNRNWPHLKKLIQLDHAGDLEKPNYLKLPVNLKELSNFKYYKTSQTGTAQYGDVHYKTPEEFLEIVNARLSSSSSVVQIEDYGGPLLNILNNADPSYWTSFDDVYLVTDSYNSVLDDTLKRSKTQCRAVIQPEWLMSDDYVPNLPVEAFAGFLEECKSTCFLRLKQMPDNKAEQKANRQQRWLSRKAWRANGGVKYPDYGRKGRR